MAEDLITQLDTAAQAILDRANGSVSLADDQQGEVKKAERVSLADQIEAFKVVMSWAERRGKLAPKAPTTKPEGRKFERLRNEFHATPGRGRNGPKAPAAEHDA